jgi:signal transduction histidine kinase
VDAPPIQVLLIEDSATATLHVRELFAGLPNAPFALLSANNLSAGLELLNAGGMDVILLDLLLPESQGLDTVLRVRDQAPSVPIVVLTGVDDEVLAIKAVQAGAQDYLVKGQVDGNALRRSLLYAIERTRRHQAEAGLQAAQEEFRITEGQLQERIRRQNRELLATTEQLRHKNAELERHSRQVQEASRLKTQFLANMSHELRTPLNSIIGFAELMHDGRVGPVSTEHKEYLGDVLTSGRHLLDLINDALDLAKIEAGKMELRPEPVDLAKLAAEIRDMLRTLAAAKRITVDTRIDTGLDRVVLDPAKLKQVLYNYLANALKFTPEEGLVVIRAGPEDADTLRLEVEDSGIGIRAEDAGRLFVEFQQIDDSTAKKYPGSGLGLALTKRIVESQGGRVGVRSTPGQGSVFFAVLPRVVPAVPWQSTPALLVVEDDPEERAWLGDILTRAGYAVTTAATGADALVQCRLRAFDAITLDLLLPDMTGIELLRRIRSLTAQEKVPVIVLSGVAEKEVADGLRIHDFLVKPIDAGELLASVQRAGVPPNGIKGTEEERGEREERGNRNRSIAKGK